MQTVNKLILGDNLEILKQLDSESVDLVYLDPPFFSNRNYEVIWGDAGEVRSFQDRWSGGMDHYIAWLKERVGEMHRILKFTGSIFLHCDWHADAYIRVEILDKIFGAQNFRNHITWQRTNAHNDAKKKMPNLCDTIFYYSKSDNWIYHQILGQLDDKYVKDNYRFEDERGRYRLGDLTAPNIRNGHSGMEWKNYNPTVAGRSWAVPNVIIESIVGQDKCKKMNVIEKLDLLDNHGYIFFSKNGIPSVKRYLENSKGTVIGDNWTDILNVQSQSKERIGYPTQKPEALLDRIIRMGSNEGDTILDPFVGGGTTIAVAEKTNRKWIGIDQSVQAVKVTEFRLNSQQNLFSQPFIVQLHKYDYDTLRYKDAFEFESWIITQYGGQPQNKKGGDKGIDGKSKDNTPIQVKRSDNIDVNVIKNFFVSAKQYDKTLFEKNVAENKPVGSIIAFSFGKGAIQEVARLKNQEDVTIKLIRVDEIVPIAKKPTITVEVHEIGRDKKDICEIEFIATGSSAAGIEFFSWDFDYNEKDGFKPEIIIDKQGKQQHKFKAGQHIIAVKVVDNDGLDNIELIKLKVNGGVERK
ncbi:MAG: DNA methyltransferase [Candidatus Kapaibacterium sp.]